MAVSVGIVNDLVRASGCSDIQESITVTIGAAEAKVPVKGEKEVLGASVVGEGLSVGAEKGWVDEEPPGIEIVGDEKEAELLSLDAEVKLATEGVTELSCRCCSLYPVSPIH